MAFDIQAATDYVKANEGPIVAKMVYGSPTMKALAGSVYEGIKGTEKIGTLVANLSAQADACGWTPAGSLTLDEAVITVAPFKIEDSLCVKDLNTTIFQAKVKATSKGEEVLPEEQIFADTITNNVMKVIENNLWRSDTTASPAGLFDGFYRQLTIANGAVDGGSQTLTTNDNVVTATYNVAGLIPSDIYGADDLAIFMNDANFRKLTAGLVSRNLYHYDPMVSGNPNMVMLPGTSVTVYRAPGLGTSNRFYAGSLKNFILGVDGIMDAATVDMWYEKKDDAILYRVKYKQGVSKFFISQMVVTQNA